MYMYTKQRNKTNTNTKGENKQNKGKTNKKKANYVQVFKMKRVHVVPGISTS